MSVSIHGLLVSIWVNVFHDEAVMSLYLLDQEAASGQ